MRPYIDRTSYQQVLIYWELWMDWPKRHYYCLLLSCKDRDKIIICFFSCVNFINIFSVSQSKPKNFSFSHGQRTGFFQFAMKSNLYTVREIILTFCVPSVFDLMIKIKSSNQITEASDCDLEQFTTSSRILTTTKGTVHNAKGIQANLQSISLNLNLRHNLKDSATGMVR